MPELQTTRISCDGMPCRILFVAAYGPRLFVGRCTWSTAAPLPRRRRPPPPRGACRASRARPGPLAWRCVRARAPAAAHCGSCQLALGEIQLDALAQWGPRPRGVRSPLRSSCRWPLRRDMNAAGDCSNPEGSIAVILARGGPLDRMMAAVRLNRQRGNGCVSGHNLRE
jgi:hypothetical protein